VRSYHEKLNFFSDLVCEHPNYKQRAIGQYILHKKYKKKWEMKDEGKRGRRGEEEIKEQKITESGGDKAKDIP
jgi:hypothetical protein